MFDVTIAVATYNGEKYLAEQLDSLLAQTYKNLCILIRDDGSTDGTRAIIQRYVEKYPQQVRMVPESNNLGCTQNFSRLMEVSDSPYVMLSDQDDVWYPTKVEESLQTLRALEDPGKPDLPLLVHTDCDMVDGTLNKLPAYQETKLRGAFYYALKDLLIGSYLGGSSMIMNRALIKRICPIPEKITSHDHWISLVAAVTGKIGFLNKRTFAWRRHGTNLSNNSKRKSYFTLEYIRGIRPSIRHAIAVRIGEAEELMARFGGVMSPDQRKVVEDFITLPRQGFVTSRVNIARYAMRKTWFRRLMYLIFY